MPTTLQTLASSDTRGEWVDGGGMILRIMLPRSRAANPSLTEAQLPTASNSLMGFYCGDVHVEHTNWARHQYRPRVPASDGTATKTGPRRFIWCVLPLVEDGEMCTTAAYAFPPAPAEFKHAHEPSSGDSDDDEENGSDSDSDCCES